MVALANLGGAVEPVIGQGRWCLKRSLVLLAVSALLLAASSVPAFAARPDGFYVECENGTVLLIGEPSQTGRAFGQLNSSIAKTGSRGCQKGTITLI